MWRLGEFGRNFGEFPDYQTSGQSGLRKDLGQILKVEKSHFAPEKFGSD